MRKQVFRAFILMLAAAIAFCGLPFAVYAADPAQGAHVAIRTAEELSAVRNAPNGSYLLMSDIDLTQEDGGWEPIPVFSGEFDGNGYAISGLRVADAKKDAGLFRSVDGGTVKT